MNFTIKAIVLEVNEQRIRSDPSAIARSTGTFVGNDYASQFDLTSRLKNNYPILTQLVERISRNVTSACIETLTHIEADFELIRDVIAPEISSGLLTITWGSGDPHRKCRSVAIIKLRSGANFVYKPRSMDSDIVFCEILELYSSLKGAVKFWTYQSITVGDHGYCHYVRNEDCGTVEDAAEYFYKCGHLVALYWLIGGSDLHYENIIAFGSNPVLIDLETLLDKPLAKTGKRSEFRDACEVAARDLLLKIGIMPAKKPAIKGEMDVSAFGGPENQSAKVSVEQLVSLGWNNVRFVTDDRPLKQVGSPPIVNGKPAKFSDYWTHFFTGYEDGIEVIRGSSLFHGRLKHILSGAKDVPIRWVPRRTQDYRIAQQQIGHPAALVNCTERDMIMGAHLAPFGSSDQYLLPLVRSEHDDLLNGDIPYFWTTPGSTDLFASDGTQIPGFFGEDAIQGVYRRLKLTKVIKPAHRASLLSSASLVCDPIPLVDCVPIANNGAMDNIAGQAFKIAEYLCETAHWVSSFPFYVGNCISASGVANSTLLPPTLYDGVPGIGLFIAYCYKVTGETRFLDYARRTHKLVRMLARGTYFPKSCGAFSGYAGLIFVDLHLSVLLGTDPIIREAAVQSQLRSLLATGERFDLISGSAGALIVLIRALELKEMPSLRALARVAADRLSKSGEYDGANIFWHNPDFDDQILGGLAHGSAGVAWALAEWLRIDEGVEYVKCVESAFRHQLEMFDEATATWIDARDQKENSFWCHGATGIGLAANKISKVLGSEQCDTVVNIIDQVGARRAAL